MPMKPEARAPRPRGVELHAQVLADPAAVRKMDPLRMLTFVRATYAALQNYEFECVAAARKASATWQDVGDVVGMPRQNAQRKYGGTPTQQRAGGQTKKRTNERRRTNP